MNPLLQSHEKTDFSIFLSQIFQQVCFDYNKQKHRFRRSHFANEQTFFSIAGRLWQLRD